MLAPPLRTAGAFLLALPVVLGTVREISGTPPLAVAAELHAVDGYGRPVRGLEVEVLLRDGDGKLRWERCATSRKDGLVTLPETKDQVVSARAVGDHAVVADTWWSEKGRTNAILTVAPLIDVDLRLTDAEGAPAKDFGAVFEMLGDRDKTDAGILGANRESFGALSRDGVAKLRVPRGAERLKVYVPRSVATDASARPDEPCWAPDFVLGAANGHDLHLYLPKFAEGPVTWKLGDAPCTTAVLVPGSTVLSELPDFVARLGAPADAEGVSRVLEPLDREGGLDRTWAHWFRVLPDPSSTESQAFTMGPVDAAGYDVSLTERAASCDLPDAPKGVTYTWIAGEDPAVQTPLASAVLPEGSSTVIALPTEGPIAERVVLLGATVYGPPDAPIEFGESRARIDTSELDEDGHWLLDAWGSLVDENDLSIDVEEFVRVERSGRVRTLVEAGPESAQLVRRGPGHALLPVAFATNDEGVLVPSMPTEKHLVEFVDERGRPLPWLHFTAELRSTFRGDPFHGWADGRGKGRIYVTPEEGTSLHVRVAPCEKLPGTVHVLEGEGPHTVVVAAPARVTVDAAKIAGGDPRRLMVVLAPEREGANEEVRDRVGRSLPYFTDGSGVLVLEGLPAGTYRAVVSEPMGFFDWDGKSAVVEAKPL
ncbi:MAG: hypothetical protein R3F34_08120 [Planctomycetota bacterium]